mmetsp:Transcript_81067/g.216521  ORF Transcript_81067/g.216521 Transcript_81067/m.216521 type:complete len:293 (-) Transcript_81067:1108-1986(-)
MHSCHSSRRSSPSDSTASTISERTPNSSFSFSPVLAFALATASWSLGKLPIFMAAVMGRRMAVAALSCFSSRLRLAFNCTDSPESAWALARSSRTRSSSAWSWSMVLCAASSSAASVARRFSESARSLAKSCSRDAILASSFPMAPCAVTNFSASSASWPWKSLLSLANCCSNDATCAWSWPMTPCASASSAASLASRPSEVARSIASSCSKDAIRDLSEAPSARASTKDPERSSFCAFAAASCPLRASQDAWASAASRRAACISRVLCSKSCCTSASFCCNCSAFDPCNVD